MKTYKESYMQLSSLKELTDKVKVDTTIALFFGGNPDRVKAIEDAMNEVAEEKGWNNEEIVN